MKPESSSDSKSASTTPTVGAYIKQKRQQKGLSQRALGQLLSPPVTTQFISNIERGVTPLPADHIPKLVGILEIPESELLQLLEAEYSAKLSRRVGFHPSGSGEHTPTRQAFERAAAAFAAARPEIQEEVRSVLMRLLQVAV